MGKSKRTYAKWQLKKKKRRSNEETAGSVLEDSFNEVVKWMHIASIGGSEGNDAVRGPHVGPKIVYELCQNLFPYKL